MAQESSDAAIPNLPKNAKIRNIKTINDPPEEAVDEAKKDEVHKRKTAFQKLNAVWRTKLMTAADDSDEDAQLRATLTELSFYFLFYCIMLVVAYGKYSMSDFYMNRSLSRQIFDVKFLSQTGTTLAYMKMDSPGDIAAYLEKGLIDLLFWNYYYHWNDAVVVAKKTDRHILYENSVVGKTYIRMLRVTETSCEVLSSFKHQFKSCYGPYSEEHEDRSDIIGVTTARDPDTIVWRYHKKLIKEKLSGIFAKYGRGGFIQLLPGKSMEATKRIIHIMKKSQWISRGTRMLDISVITFNTQVKLFSKINLLIEFPPSGGAYPNGEVHTVKLFPYMTKSDAFVAGFEMVFVIFIIYFIFMEAREFYFFGWRYFSFLANILDTIILVVGSYMCIHIMHRARTYVDNVTEKIANAKDGHVDLDSYFRDELTFLNASAVLGWLCTVKLVRFIEFSPQMTMLMRIMKRSTSDVCGFLVMFSLLFWAFAALGFLLFGTTIAKFKTITDSLYTCLELLLGNYDYLKLADAYRVLGPIFFFAFIFFIFFVMLNMFLAIMNEAYDIITSRPEPPRLALESYLRRGLSNIFTCIERPTNLVSDPELSEAVVVGVREALRQNNFTPKEIKMFLAKYGIDEQKMITHEQVEKIYNDLRAKSIVPTKSQEVNEVQMKQTQAMRGKGGLMEEKDHQNTLSIKNYDFLLQRLIELEMQIDTMHRRLVDTIQRLDRAEKNIWVRIKTDLPAIEGKKQNQ